MPYTVEISVFFCHSEFDVKLILKKVEVVKLQFLSILRVLNLVNLVNLSLQKLQFSATKCAKMADFPPRE